MDGIGKLFDVGGQYPPAKDIERLAKYKRGKAIFDGKTYEIYERASELLKGTPFANQIAQLYIAVNLVDVLLTKPADLMVAHPPTYESGKPDESPEQKALNRIVEENDLNQLMHEIVIGAGYRGDAWLESRYAIAHDLTETKALGLVAPEVKPEPIIEAVDAMYVFPELSRGSRKRFKAVNIAWVEWVEGEKEDIPFLNVRRHIPGYIVYERFKLDSTGVDTRFGADIQTFTIVERAPTGREENIVETGVPQLLMHHVPYKTTDSDWVGISGIEKIESVLAAINDRLVQIDYILWKHADPTAYGPDLPSDKDGAIRFGGKYIPVSKDEQAPGYMTWNSQLEAAFRQLDILLGIVYQMSETPQWLFGTTLSEDKGGTGTSHSDGRAIKARFMPILSKVSRIRNHVDVAVRDALWTAMELEIFANEGVDDFDAYEPDYPKIHWADPLPRDEKEEAEIYAIRTGQKPTLDVRSAIKRMDGVDDVEAAEVIARIGEDTKRTDGFVDPSIFNEDDEE